MPIDEWYSFLHIKNNNKQMNKAKLFYNPGAGGSSYQPGDIVSILEAKGYDCTCVSVKEKGWKKIEDDIDFIIISGGDGTVRKVCTFLLNNNKAHLPIGVLPMGTANNIASTLKIKGEVVDIISSWRIDNIQKYDVGKIRFADETHFFFESFGCGLFPYFFKKADKEKLPEAETTEQSLFHALKKLEQIIPRYNSFHSDIQVDEKDVSGNYFLVELMLVQHIGPGITLAHNSELNDSYFDLILLSPRQKEALATYVSDKLNAKEDEIVFPSTKVKKGLIQSQSNLIHVDDEVIDILPGTAIKIKILPEALHFLKL